MNVIKLRGVRTHNLKNIDIDLPRDKLVVITGLSGSGKSSLAFDTLYAEGQRRYVESLSSYARQFLSMMSKPDVDAIEGLSPAIAIEQKSASHNPRSTVGTITEIHDYLRLLFARVGEPKCPHHQQTLKIQTISQMVDSVLSLPEGTRVLLLAPVIRERKGEHLELLQKLQHEGFIRARINGELVELEAAPKLDLRKKHTIEVVIDRIKVRADIKQRLAESFETAVNLTNGLASIVIDVQPQEERLFSARFACPECGYSIEELEPRMFSFNSPVGACVDCDGLGVKQYFDIEKVVQNPSLSLAAGAIRGWDKRTYYYYQILLSLAAHYHFDLDMPFKQLPKRIREIILQGSGDESIKFEFLSPKQKKVFREYPFEGILANMERRYRETDSNSVREELAKYLSMSHCMSCMGSRLKLESRNVFIEEKSLPAINKMTIEKAKNFLQHLVLVGKRATIAEKILKEVNARLGFLVDVGLNYLTLERSAETLSGGEAQRIRLASQIGSGLMGVMYILDEPSIGLHQRDNMRLLKTLNHLRDLGNTVIVVEHDEEAILAADWVVDIGPGAGVHGGYVVAVGPPLAIKENPESLTGQYLSGKKKIEIPKRRVSATLKSSINIRNACINNLKNVDVDIPIGLFTCITGVSGSGKSSLINDTLYPIATRVIYGNEHHSASLQYATVKGLDSFDKVVNIDQSPIGRTPRSNPATYTNLFTPIREIFVGTPEARSRGYKPGRFSFNVRGGRCEACEGDGVIKVEMHFLADIYVTCDECKGKRYNRETLEVEYKGKNIHQILSMTVEDARQFFDPVPLVARKLQTLIDVGLSYITLGQSATTLSGGEAQRIKLSRELSRRDTGNTLYILDEPTTGLHFQDINQLLQVLLRLREHGNTVIVIEHNLDVIKVADWVIDLGPEGGEGGGTILASGTPETIAKNKKSYTGQFLQPLLHP